MTQRYALALINRTFTNSTEDQVRIFNMIFHDELKARDLPAGITKNALESQLWDMRAGNQGYAIWKLLNIERNT